MLYPYPEYLWHGCTDPPEVPGTGMYAVHNSQKFRVRVIPGYIYSPSREEVDLKLKTSSDLHGGAFSLGKRLRSNP